MFYKIGPWGQCYKTFYRSNLRHSIVIPSFCVIKLYYLGSCHRMAVNYHGILTLEKVGPKLLQQFTVVLLYKIGPSSQCNKTLIYCHSTLSPSFCVIKQYYDGNYHGMAVSNTTVIYHGISTLEITGIFKTLAVNYRSIWTLE